VILEVEAEVAPPIALIWAARVDFLARWGGVDQVPGARQRADQLAVTFTAARILGEYHR